MHNRGEMITVRQAIKLTFFSEASVSIGDFAAHAVAARPFFLLPLHDDNNHKNCSQELKGEGDSGKNFIISAIGYTFH